MFRIIKHEYIYTLYSFITISFHYIGLNHDIWHTVTVRIDVHGARLIAKVDDISAEKLIQGLHKSSNYGISTDLTSVVLIGGMNKLNYTNNIRFRIKK